jgi:hypothetical protein
MSTDVSRTQEEGFFPSGIDGYLEKPFTLNSFRDEISRWIETT